MIIFWFRRDLRLADNHALFQALQQHTDVQPIFIFDREILDDLQEPADRRVDFIHQVLAKMQSALSASGVHLWVFDGKPDTVFRDLLQKENITAVYANKDYEPYAIKRDRLIASLLNSKDIPFHSYKDQVLFEEHEILKKDGKPYTVFTPYMKRWKQALAESGIPEYPSENYVHRFQQRKGPALPVLDTLGFKRSDYRHQKPDPDPEIIRQYDKTRDIPGISGTSRMSAHLRFGTISVRSLIKMGLELNDTYLNELIWRDFYQMILFQFPHTTDRAFKPAYDHIQWINDESAFERWRSGTTGYPIVDAGMRELSQTGYMHNRVRMITASFLIKHLLIDWRWGEAWFAEKLLDFELASNVGGWQWVAGSGCDGAPYFRIFNPYSQTDKFDPERKYIRQWVPEIDTPQYPEPMVEHSFARERALAAYKEALKTKV